MSTTDRRLRNPILEFISFKRCVSQHLNTELLSLKFLDHTTNPRPYAVLMIPLYDNTHYFLKTATSVEVVKISNSKLSTSNFHKS
ncbi:hypothetical protein M758_4G130100 [Ceratodon purpureus]|nr:hypothetical protein M758_4G130100 [Ceratodon purpureus]